ncbi:MAG TPA: metallopeptidase TldD-related protein [Bryobacteraceae bacterium]|nr:metallopeptidase TldD-related protein [Bryobacteraceae bacterium]
MQRVLRTVILALWAATIFGNSASLLDILSGELERNFRVLHEKGDPPAYYIAYAVTDQESHNVGATLGALQVASHASSRWLDVTVRVGSPELDNYHRLSGDRFAFSSAVRLPLENVPAAICQRLWMDTDGTYRRAAERLIKVRTAAQVKAVEADSAADFSKEEPAIYEDAPQPLEFSPQDWQDRVRKWSAAFGRYPRILASSVSVSAQLETKYLVTSEGSRIEQGKGLARIALSAQTKAPDGMDLTSEESFESETVRGLPGDKEVLGAVERVAKELTALLSAPDAEPFVGPAILSGRAAGVFFHEIFGHRIEGHRQNDETEGQTFAKAVGTKVLPDFLSVFSDPTIRKLHGVDLSGHYLYDDEGVKARRVTVVESGILRNFLLSRSPMPGFDHSNGHGRRQPGFDVVSRQSTLIVESSKTVDEARLRGLLIEEIRRQKKPYGLYFEKVTGGYTQTSRRGLQAYTVVPIIVYRVYADGRPDELVRGADIVGTPLASFSKILAASDQPGVFNGYCGAESGSLPVSAVAPSLLVSEIEIQKKEKGQDRPPLLPAPSGEWRSH